MAKCADCEFCTMLVFDHPYFGEVEKIVCVNVLDDEMAEVPDDMLFADHLAPCYTFSPKGSGKKEEPTPVVFTME